MSLIELTQIPWNWGCKIFGLKIRRCKILDKSPVCSVPIRSSAEFHWLTMAVLIDGICTCMTDNDCSEGWYFYLYVICCHISYNFCICIWIVFVFITLSPSDHQPSSTDWQWLFWWMAGEHTQQRLVQTTKAHLISQTSSSSSSLTLS